MILQCFFHRKPRLATFCNIVNRGLFPVFKRRERDSNSRTGFAGHTLSRRASSATRASLPGLLSCECGCKGRVFHINVQTFSEDFFRNYQIQRLYDGSEQCENGRMHYLHQRDDPLHQQFNRERTFPCMSNIVGQRWNDEV